MHGKVRTPTWTSLSETAALGSSTIKVEEPGELGRRRFNCYCYK